jgi:hypothetical protein
MVVGTAADAGGHLVLADWVQENLNWTDLAAALRLSAEDPRARKDRDKTNYWDFRYQLLDPAVLLYLARWRVSRPWRKGQKAPDPEGRLLGLCVSPQAPEGAVRWVRWFPEEAALATAVMALWDLLGKNVPASEE